MTSKYSGSYTVFKVRRPGGISRVLRKAIAPAKGCTIVAVTVTDRPTSVYDADRRETIYWRRHEAPYPAYISVTAESCLHAALRDPPRRWRIAVYGWVEHVRGMVVILIGTM